MKTRTSLLRFVFVFLVMHLCSPAACDEKEGLNLNSAQHLDIGMQDPIDTTLEYQSSISFSSDTTELTTVLLDWITWSLKSLKNIMAGSLNKAKTLYSLRKSPMVWECIKICQRIRDRLLRMIVTLWPWTWMQSIEIIGFSWVIGYFFYHLLRFAAMDERTLERWGWPLTKETNSLNLVPSPFTDESKMAVICREDPGDECCNSL